MLHFSYIYLFTSMPIINHNKPVAPLCRLGDAHMGLMEIQQREAKGPATRGATNGGAGGALATPSKFAGLPSGFPLQDCPMLVILINVSTRERTPPSYLIFICTYFLTRHRILLFFSSNLFDNSIIKLEIIFLVCQPNIVSGPHMATPMKKFWRPSAVEPGLTWTQASSLTLHHRCPVTTLQLLFCVLLQLLFFKVIS